MAYSASADTVVVVIGFLAAGLIIGALARLLKPGKQNLGILATLGLGVVGSLIGGTIAWLLGTGSIWELDVLGFVLAIVTFGHLLDKALYAFHEHVIPRLALTLLVFLLPAEWDRFSIDAVMRKRS